MVESCAWHYLHGFHAFTVCDYTAAFIRKGKKRPLLKLQDDRYVDAFAALATGPVDHSTCKTILDFTAKMYGAKKTIPLNRHRFLTFEKTFGPKEGRHPFASLKGVDASCIPPCEDVVRQKIHRSNFVAMMWHSACKNILPKAPQEGWELKNNEYKFVWFTCRQMPDDVVPDEEPDELEDDGNVTDIYNCDTDIDDDDNHLLNDD